jgi:hypothetical protein
MGKDSGVKVVPLKIGFDKWEKLNKQKNGNSWEDFFLNTDDWDLIHTNIHALRMTKGYKPSQFEVKIANIIVQRYKSCCAECKQRADDIEKNPQKENKKGVKDMFMDVLTGNE